MLLLVASAGSGPGVVLTELKLPCIAWTKVLVSGLGIVSASSGSSISTDTEMSTSMG